MEQKITFVLSGLGMTNFGTRNNADRRPTWVNGQVLFTKGVCQTRALNNFYLQILKVKFVLIQAVFITAKQCQFDTVESN